MGSLGNTIAAGGVTAVGAPVILYIAQMLHMPPMSDAVAGALALAVVTFVHTVSIVVEKKWGISILPEAKPASEKVN